MVSASQTIQHCKWLQEADELPWRAPVPSLNILLTSTAWRNDHNGFSHQGPGLIQNVHHRPRQHRPGLPAAGRELPAVGGRPLLPVAVLRQPHRDRQAAAAAVADDGRGGRALRPRRRRLGMGRHRRRHRRPGHRAGLRRRRRDDGDRRGRGHPARAAAALPHPRGQRRRPDDPAAPQGSPARHGRDPVQGAVHRLTSTSCSPSTATRARSTSWCTAGRTPTGSACAASSRRARPRRRSTWSCATGCRATTWSWTPQQRPPDAAGRQRR